MINVFKFQNVQSNDKCIKQFNDKPEECIFAENLLPNLESPVFILNAI